MSRFPFVVGLALTSACLDPSIPPDEIEFHGPGITTASPFQVERAAKTPRCTGTRIAHDYVLTSAHCGEAVNGTVRFYLDTTDASSHRTATIRQVFIRPGVVPSTCELAGLTPNAGCYDTSGLFADIAVLRVDNVVSVMDGDSLDSPAATLAWRYPGDAVAGQQVGTGSDPDNEVHPLLQSADLTDDTSDATGMFSTEIGNADTGDSGGPFYVNGRVLGTLYATGATADYYTSVPRHLDWVLDSMSYRWRGAPAIASNVFTGSLLESFTTTERVCQYACENTTRCEAYNYRIATQSCELQTGVTGTTSASNTHAAVRYGQSSPHSGVVTAFVANDGFDRVVHRATNGAIHSLDLNAAGAWHPTTITSTGAVPSGAKLSAYRRSDNVDAIVFRNAANHIIEVFHRPTDAPNVWGSGDLTTATGALLAAGDPAAYVRADGVNAVVYRASNNHIIELRLSSDLTWHSEDLTVDASLPVAVSSDPTAFVRSDGLSSVVFRSGTQVFEVFKASGHQWDWGQPSGVTIDGAPPAAEGRPFGYTHADGTNAIAYRNGFDVWELYSTTSGWKHGRLTSLSAAAAKGDPAAYVRADATTAVVYRSTANQIAELTLGAGTWAAWNLSSQWGAPDSVSDPVGYSRRVGYVGVVSGLASNHAGQLATAVGATGWISQDVTTLSAEAP